MYIIGNYFCDNDLLNLQFYLSYDCDDLIFLSTTTNILITSNYDY